MLHMFTKPLYSRIGMHLLGGLVCTVAMALAGQASAVTLIHNVTELQAMQNDLYESYVLANDIDASETITWNGGAGFVPIGRSPYFTGTFDGAGHKITGLYINRPDDIFVGLFGVLSTETASVSNVGLVGANIRGGQDTGALAGYVGYASITSSYSTGSVLAAAGSSYHGGLVGYLYCGSIVSSYSTATVSASVSSGNTTGGLAGCVHGSGITSSYSTGAVSGAYYVGGLAGVAQGASTITSSYSTGGASGANFVGGLVGSLGGASITTSSYSTGAVSGSSNVGGLVGFNLNSTATSSYWDMDTSGQSVSALGEGKTTPEMRQQATFIGWDFTNTWFMSGYPHLRWEPVAIHNVAELQAMQNNLTVNYVLANDIDASETATWNPDGLGGYAGFAPIGEFGATFDGARHVITGLYINRPSEWCVGLFGTTSSAASVSAVGLANVNVTGDTYVGALVGFNNAQITTAYSTGSVVGGVNLGGLVGCNDLGSIVSSYSTVSVSGSHHIGGLVGNNWSPIAFSYSTGSLSGAYNVGGLVGYNWGSVTSSYWDVTTSGSDMSAGEGKTTAQMMQQATFVGWDFATPVWGIVDGHTYPYLPGLSVGAGIEQATGQSDPVPALPIVFNVVFSEPVTGFDNTDVDFSGGTATVTAYTVTDLGGGAAWQVNVTAMTGYGTVVARIKAGVCAAVSNGAPNNVSASVDNTVTRASITVTSPNGGEAWTPGVAYPITWSSTLSGNVRIYLYNNATQVHWLADAPASAGTWTWNMSLTETPGTTYKIRIYSLVDTALGDYSDNNLTLTAPLTLSVTAPNGGESWNRGASYPITWSTTVSGNVAIYLYNNGTAVQFFANVAASAGTWTWNIPAGLALGTTYKIRVYSLVNTALGDYSDNNFSIVAPPVLVTSPNGGESWTPGVSYPITWSSTLTGNVRIYLYSNGTQVRWLGDALASAGTWTWNMWLAETPGATYKIRIYSLVDTALGDYSNNNFTITAPLTLSVTAPNGGEAWNRGMPYPITWSTTVSGNVAIYLYNNGTAVQFLANAVASAGTWTWNIPVGLALGTTYKIRVYSLVNTALGDYSNNNFSITSPLTVTSPNGGESRTPGMSYPITWSTVLSGNVRIYLYNNGTAAHWLGDAPASAGTWTWNMSLTETPGTTYKIKVYSMVNTALCDYSDNNFTITAPLTLTVTAPNGGESWQRGTPHPITWSTTVGSGNVAIYLYNNGTAVQFLANASASAGTWTWNIPVGMALGSTYKIRVYSSVNTALGDYSDTNFTIAP